MFAQVISVDGRTDLLVFDEFTSGLNNDKHALFR